MTARQRRRQRRARSVLYPWTTMKDMYGSRWSSALSRESMDAAIARARVAQPDARTPGSAWDLTVKERTQLALMRFDYLGAHYTIESVEHEPGGLVLVSALVRV